jgi:hypothetical protein
MPPRGVNPIQHEIVMPSRTPGCFSSKNATIASIRLKSDGPAA